MSFSVPLSLDIVTFGNLCPSALRGGRRLHLLPVGLLALAFVHVLTLSLSRALTLPPTPLSLSSPSLSHFLPSLAVFLTDCPVKGYHCDVRRRSSLWPSHLGLARLQLFQRTGIIRAHGDRTDWSRRPVPSATCLDIVIFVHMRLGARHAFNRKRQPSCCLLRLSSLARLTGDSRPVVLPPLGLLKVVLMT